ncbi:MAG: hypothetical protein COT15_02415 [Candidatus Diapherotrites archaeon CG08_land_8_20_14_0_20_34_12]|nr:MAG: hypothetical protein COT15_02415 [Candidatus Diapherotrites archaeon CG08_land_8_20_14_0_20_34_12]
MRPFISLLLVLAFFFVILGGAYAVPVCKADADCGSCGSQYISKCDAGVCKYLDKKTGNVISQDLCPDGSEPEMPTDEAEPFLGIPEIQLPFSILLVLCVLVILGKKSNKTK